jgi:hypothetical protein
VSSLSCSSFDTIEEDDMAERSWFVPTNVVALPVPSSNGQRTQTEMTILASSSPEIQALHKAYYAKTNTPRNFSRNQGAITSNQNAHRCPTSPTSSITSYSSISRANACLILSSTDGIPKNENDELLMSDNYFQSNEQPLYTVNYQDNIMPDLMIRPPQAPIRNNVMFGTRSENAPQNSHHSLELSFQCDDYVSNQALLNRSSSERVLPHSSLRKPSFHRRVSHDSLPSPTEIAAFPSAVPPAPSSTRPHHNSRNDACVVPPGSKYYPKFQC